MICKCGHLQNMHTTNVPPWEGNQACYISRDSQEFHFCTYQRDNLSYLEYLYDQRKEVANGKK